MHGAFIPHSQLAIQHPGTRISLYKYQSLVHAIPRDWKVTIRQNACSDLESIMRSGDAEVRMTDGSTIALKKATCKVLYKVLLPKATESRCLMKWAEKAFRFTAEQWSHIYLLPYNCCTSTKLQTLQYRIINRYIPTRKFLYLQ